MGRPISKRNGVRHLGKAHDDKCPNKQGDDIKCDCPWRARVLGQQVMLGKWANPTIKPTVEPRSRTSAVAALDRLKGAIRNKSFEKEGERRPSGTDESFAAFITEFKSRHIEKQALTGNSLDACLDVIARSPLGALSLDALADGAQRIEQWLDAQGKKKAWKPRTWNSYHQILHTVCHWATIWTIDGQPRMASNPMAKIPTRRGGETQNRFQELRVSHDIEQRLLAACDQMNRIQHFPNRTHLTMEKADAIRARVAGGETQKAVAKAFKVTPTTVNEIVKGVTWNPAKYRVSTRGTEMRRRVICAFDTGLRASEMLRVQVKHVVWSRPEPMQDADGQPFNGYQIVLPPTISKGGKFHGQKESVFVATVRSSQDLEARRFALKNNPEAFLYGTEEGWSRQGIKRAWRDLFTLAGLEWGRDQGLVWHTLRHEYISRIADTQEAQVAQQMARHRDLKTTQLYMHTGRDQKWKAARGLNR